MKKKTLLFLYIAILCSISLYAQNDKYFIKLRTGETKFGKLEYKVKLFGTDYILMNDSIKYLLTEIKSYQVEEGYFIRTSDFRNKFAKRIKEGKISLYAESYSFATSGHTVSASFKGGSVPIHIGGSASFEYFTKGNDELKEVNYANLYKALSDNQLSLEHLETSRTLKYVTWGLAITGVALLIGSKAGSKCEVNETMIGFGITAGISAWITSMISSNKQETAIEVYNR